MAVGYVAVGRDKARFVRNKIERMTALRAKLRGGRNLGPTIGTDSPERRGTLLAEFRSYSIIVLAIRTLHLSAGVKKR
jgi:hypothetical protein